MSPPSKPRTKRGGPTRDVTWRRRLLGGRRRGNILGTIEGEDDTRVPTSTELYTAVVPVITDTRLVAERPQLGPESPITT